MSEYANIQSPLWPRNIRNDEAGIVLKGFEVKVIKTGKANIKART